VCSIVGSPSSNICSSASAHLGIAIGGHLCRGKVAGWLSFCPLAGCGDLYIRRCASKGATKSQLGDDDARWYYWRNHPNTPVCQKRPEFMCRKNLQQNGGVRMMKSWGEVRLTNPPVLPVTRKVPRHGDYCTVPGRSWSSMHISLHQNFCRAPLSRISPRIDEHDAVSPF
jgi:hypothetical protein